MLFFAASEIVVFVYLLGFRSFQRYCISFLIVLYVTWFCFSEKVAFGHLFHYLLIKMFWSLRTNRQGLPENFLNLLFNLIFYVALYKYLYISNALAVFFIKRVLTNFAKLTENTQVPDFSF